MQRTRWGGVADQRFPATGFFRVEQQGGVCWLVDPDGGRFLSKGVNNIRFDPDNIHNTERVPYREACTRKYGDRFAWRTAAADRLRAWHFNTVGCWSDEHVAGAGSQPLAYARTADLGASFRLHRPDEAFPDVFDPGFAAHVADRARSQCAPHRNATALLGTFIDNELHWSTDWRGGDELLTLFMNLPPRRPGRIAALEMLQAHYRDIGNFNAAWRLNAASWEQLGHMPQVRPPFVRLPPGGANEAREAAANRQDPLRAVFASDCDAFASVVADRYFELCVFAIKAVDPHHLVIGSRFGAPALPGVIAAAARHLDVISFNCYAFDPTETIAIFAAADKPCLITEFSFRGDDAGLPNSRGGGPRVAGQTERAAAFEAYVSAALRQPSIVGYHWFEHADQPAAGRFDGEDSNYGVVTIEDEVYSELTATMTRVNARAEALHAAGTPAA
jgi:agarase